MRISVLAAAVTLGVGFTGAVSAAPLTDTRTIIGNQSLIEHVQSSRYWPASAARASSRTSGVREAKATAVVTGANAANPGPRSGLILFD